MRMTSIPFGTTDWSTVEPTTHKGEVGVATWRTRQFGDIRVRMVEYSPGYVADHWCEKGHILLCVDGRVAHGLEGRPLLHADARHELPGRRRRRCHRSHTGNGARLFIVD